MVARRFANAALGSMLALASVGCGDASAITLTAQIQNPEVNLNEVTLGTQLTARFDLFMELGPEADRSTTVELGGFELLAVGGGSVTNVDAVPTEAFPVTIGKGDRKIVPFTIEGDALLSDSDRDALCAQPIQFAGSISDTISGNIPLRSAELTASGCP